MTTLLADIGGTHARFSVYRAGKLSPVKIYYICGFNSFEEILSTYLPTLSTKPTRFILAATGTIKNNVLTSPNLTWKVDGKKIKSKYGFTDVLMINDFHAQGLGVLQLKQSDILPLLSEKAEKNQPKLLIGPGTGLGCCFIKDNVILTSEGGHATLCTITDEQKQIKSVLETKFPHVSFERVLSGPGIINIYNAIAELNHQKTISTKNELYQRAKDKEKTALSAYRLFFEFLGIFAGNMALVLKTTGGVYLTGAILQDPYMQQLLKNSACLSYFKQKGRFENYLRSIPLYLIINDNMPFLGLKHLAQNQKK